MNEQLKTADYTDIVQRYLKRRELFPDEDEAITLSVVLVNYGDHLTEVRCIRGDWSGTKADIRSPIHSIPTCPYGHPLIESRQRYRLGLIETSL